MYTHTHISYRLIYMYDIYINDISHIYIYISRINDIYIF